MRSKNSEMSCRKQFIGWALSIGLTIAFSCAVGARPRSDSISPIRYLAGHTDAVHAVAFFPDGKRLATAGADKTIRIWDVATGRPLLTLAGHEGTIWAIDISPDGKQIASAGDDLTVRVWDADSGAQTAQLVGHTRTVRGVAFLPNGQLISGAASGDGTLRIWNLNTEREIWRIEDGCVLTLTLSADRNRVAFGGCAGNGTVWDLKAQKRLAHFPIGHGHGSTTTHIAISADGRYVYTSRDVDIEIYDVEAGGWAEKTPNRIQQFYDFAASPDRKWIGTAGGEIVDAKDARHLFKLSRVDADQPQGNCIAFSHDRRFAAVGRGGKPVNVWEWQPGIRNEVHLYEFPAPVSAAAPARKPAGLLTWEAIPARIRDAHGVVEPYASRTYRDNGGMFSDWKFRAAQVPGAGGAPRPIDLVFNDQWALLHREPGIMDLLDIPYNVGSRSAAWDGEKFWLASSFAGLYVIDPSGRIDAKLAADQGLPVPCSQRIVVHAVSPGKVLVAGECGQEPKSEGWCALVESNGEKPASYRVKMLFHEGEIPGGWGDQYLTRRAEEKGRAFHPLFVIEPPRSAPGQAREAWIVCDGVPRSPHPIVRINLETFAISSFNLAPQPADGKWPTAENQPFGGTQEVSPSFLDSNTLLFTQYNHWFTNTLNPAISYLAEKSSRLLFDPRDYFATRQPPLASNGKLYFPGNTWFSLDPATSKIVRLGLGPRGRDDGPSTMRYFNSAHFGLAAFCSRDGNFYRMSVDPAHPLPLHGVEEPPLAAPAPIAPGFVEYGAGDFGPDTITFRRGLGDITFKAGRLVTPASFDGSDHAALLNSERRQGVGVDELREIIALLSRHETERTRIGLSEAQWQTLRSAIPAPSIWPSPALAPGIIGKFERTRGGPALPPEIVKRLESLFALYAQAEGDDSRDKAAEPLLAEAEKLGEKWAKEADAYLTSTRGVFSDAQWRMLRYESER